MDDRDRLEAYDAFARAVRAELVEASATMEVLRDRGKVRGATYRQLFAARITLRDIDRRLSECGL